MTEPTPEAETEAGVLTGRGRPRPETTVARDADVLEFLKGVEGPQTRKQIVAATGKPGNEVYLSLYRLSRANEIHRVGGTWAVGAAPEPVPAE